ncbi:hypothetical protein [Luteolibacter soli]|uniref:DUF304 domain-containing protein n=1 Tax=Luteolibacter soli TaxID=3135280 RepID=A0ABU9B3C0_9BACT
MIYDDSRIELCRRDDELVIRERDTWLALWRLLGLLPMGIGGLVLYVMIINHSPQLVGALPQRAIGFVVLSFFGCALGVLPFWAGFHMVFVRRGFTLSLSRSRIQSHVFLLGYGPVWTRNYPLELFDRVRLAHRKVGAFGGSWALVVSCAGPSKTLDLFLFRDQAKAEAYAEEIGAFLMLPIEPKRPVR